LPECCTTAPPAEREQQRDEAVRHRSPPGDDSYDIRQLIAAERHAANLRASYARSVARCPNVPLDDVVRFSAISMAAVGRLLHDQAATSARYR
jgi:hypothetical protein